MRERELELELDFNTSYQTNSVYEENRSFLRYVDIAVIVFVVVIVFVFVIVWLVLQISPSQSRSISPVRLRFVADLPPIRR